MFERGKLKTEGIPAILEKYKDRDVCADRKRILFPDFPERKKSERVL